MNIQKTTQKAVGKFTVLWNFYLIILFIDYGKND